MRIHHFNILLRPFRSNIFLYLFLLNTVSNLAYAIYGNGSIVILSMLALGSLSAYVETFVYMLIPWQKIKIIWLTFVVVIHNILLIIDYFLIYNFHMVIGQDVVDILAETNTDETVNFANTYLGWTTILVWLAFLLLANILILAISRLLGRIQHIWAYALLCIAGVAIMAFCIYNFILYRNGMTIPQYQTSTRLGYSIYIMHQRMQTTVELRDICQKVEAVAEIEEKPTIVVVIGESASVYHSQLYGYDKSTNPLLQKRVADSTLYVYDDVVSTSCLTHNAMKSVFSLDSLGCGSKTLFPACFKVAGYHTELHDNQYFVGSGVNFLADKELSNILFDTRNTQRYRYDIEMVNSINLHNEPALYIIHLLGQHYTYSQRYPDGFNYYRASDYDTIRWKEKQRERIACYDNATRYNDFVINQIIDKFEKNNSCVVYFSDHGEELYEQGNYAGHGNAEHSADISYQIRVPLIVWLSPSFSRSEIRERLKVAEHLPITTDDMGHFLLDIAGIKTHDFSPYRSFINKHYKADKPRMVLNSIDYNKKLSL